MKINNIKNAGLDFLHTVREKTSEVLKSAGEVAKRGAVIALSGVIAVGCAVPAASAASDDIIDTTKTGTMHIRKYDMTAAQEGGVDLNQFIANGEQDPDAEEALANYELEGVQFSPTFAGEIATYSQEGTVILTYSIPATLRNILELSASDAIWSSGDKLYYTSTQLNDAMQEGLRDNTNFKNKLEEWAAAGALSMPLTDSRGHTSLSNLPLGLYLIVETKVPENVHTTVDPYFISLPSTDATGDHWFYTVYSYPKNQNNDPLLDKLVSEDGTYADTATVSEGDTLNYRLSSKLPTITSKATYLSEYTFTDELSKGLTYNKDVVISFYDNEDGAKHATGSSIATWSANSNPTLFSAAYENTADGTKMTVKPTTAGLAEINNKYSDAWMVVSYTADVTSTADMICGDEGNENEVKLTYRRTSENYFNFIEDRAKVYTFGINLDKNFSDGQGDATKVQFVLFNKIDNYYVTATGEDGLYYVTGKATEESGATRFSPASSGSLVIKGLEGDTYDLTEIKTDKGYSLLKGKITIEILPTETSITPSTACLTGSATDHTEIAEVVTKEAMAIVDNSSANMSADVNSANALVDMSIQNNRDFELPKTGGVGTWMITICGVVGVAGGVFLLRKGKRTAKRAK